MTNRFSLDHLRAFSLDGRDAHAFAQSQFTVAIEDLTSRRWSPLAWCDPKGRVLSVMMALPSENGVELAVPAEQVDGVREKLQLFTIGRDVRISSARRLAGRFQADEYTYPLSIDESRGMCVEKAEHPDPQSLKRWQLLDMCGGLPWLTPETGGQHLPQWLGLERLGALVFDKGCYPGQEVIARLHYRGTVKYRLAGLAFKQAPGSARHARVSDDQGRKLGHSLEVLKLDSGGVGLAVIQREIEPGAFVVVHEGGRQYRARVTAPEGLC